MQNLKNQIKDLEAQTTSLEPSPEQRRQWQAAADKALGTFYSELPSRRTFTPAHEPALQKLYGELEQAKDMDSVLTAVANGVASTGVLAAGPGHLAFIPGGGLYAGAIADYLAAGLNTFSADSFSSQVAVHIHGEVVRWLAATMGYGAGAWGDITSGGSHATLTAFYGARQAHKLRARDYEKTCVYLSEHVHHCCQKALRVLFGDDLCVRKAPISDAVIDADKLREMIEEDKRAGLKPWMIVATAGSTNLGRVDPIQKLAGLAKDTGLWLHVDGAYGGFFKMCPESQAHFAGINEADSIVLDPHKGMFLPYGCGAVLFKDGELLRSALDQTGVYLQDRKASEQKSPMEYSIELTRPFRSLRIWLALKIHGEEVFRKALQEKLLLAEYCWQQLAQVKHLTLVGKRDLSILAFRCEDPSGRQDGDAYTRALLERVKLHPEAFLSSTVVEGRFVIRVAILSFRTHIKTIDSLLQTLKTELI